MMRRTGHVRGFLGIAASILPRNQSAVPKKRSRPLHGRNLTRRATALTTLGGAVNGNKVHREVSRHRLERMRPGTRASKHMMRDRCFPD